MRNLLVAVLLAAVVTPSIAHADVEGILSRIDVPAAGPQARAYDKGLAMKRHGMAASILGIIQLAIGSAAGLAAIVPVRRCSGDVCSENGAGIVAFAVGATFTGLGAISTSAGIPMWVYGAREVEHAKLSLSASATGLTLRF